MPDPDPLDGSGTVLGADGRRRPVRRDRPPAARWHLLASTWLDLPARPSLIGERGPDGKPYAALSDSLYSTAAPLDRRLLLTMLADLPPGAGVDAASAVAGADLAAAAVGGPAAARAGRATCSPRRTRSGVVGRGAIATPARLLLAGASEDAVIDGDGQGAAHADRPLPAAGRPDRGRARPAGTRTGRAARRGRHRRVGGRRDGVPDQRAVDPAGTGHRAHRGRAARPVRPALQNPGAARVDVPHRRRRAPARSAARRHGGVVRPLRGSRAAGPGGRRTRRRAAGRADCWRRPSRCRRRRSPRCSPRCARRASRPPPRTPSGAIVDIRARGARVAAPTPPAWLPPAADPERADAGRHRRGAAQGGRPRRPPASGSTPPRRWRSCSRPPITRGRW